MESSHAETLALVVFAQALKVRVLLLPQHKGGERNFRYSVQKNRFRNIFFFLFLDNPWNTRSTLTIGAALKNRITVKNHNENSKWNVNTFFSETDTMMYNLMIVLQFINYGRSSILWYYYYHQGQRITYIISWLTLWFPPHYYHYYYYYYYSMVFWT